MATQSRPIMNRGVALASAAAIAAATPAIMPTLDVPTHALATAEVQLATFADVMSVPASAWTEILFSTVGWGGTLSSGTFGPEWAAPQTVFAQPGYVNPWAGFCNGECFESGISGVAYLFFDALINGDGTGYDNSANWPIGFVNYLFEPIAVFAIGGGSAPSIQITNPGPSSAAWYALQGTIGQAFPELTVPIAALFWGPTNLSVAYNAALLVVAAGLSAVPLIGPFLGNSVIAYLGDLQIPGTVQPDELFYQFGLSGTLNYWIDIATGAVPFPTGTVPPAASPAPVEAATALVSAAASATSAALKSDVTDITPATEAVAPEASPAVEVAEATPVAEAPENIATDADAPTTPAVDLPAAEVADVAAVKAPKRPVRSAVERAAKSVQSALGATKADTASSDAVSPGGSVGSVGSVGSAAESASSDAGPAGGDAGSASSETGSADSAG
jgi:hypothetical protein